MQLTFVLLSLPDKPDEERKASLIKYFKKAVIQFTRLLVLIKWSDKLQSLQTVQVRFEKDF
jgi:hypothetical protein